MCSQSCALHYSSRQGNGSLVFFWYVETMTAPGIFAVLLHSLCHSKNPFLPSLSWVCQMEREEKPALLLQRNWLQPKTYWGEIVNGSLCISQLVCFSSAASELKLHMTDWLISCRRHSCCSHISIKPWKSQQLNCIQQENQKNINHGSHSNSFQNGYNHVLMFWNSCGSGGGCQMA